MQTVPRTSEGVRRGATGALFSLGFGSVWIDVGLLQTHHASLRAVLLLVLVGVCMAIASLWLLRRSRDLPPGHMPHEAEQRARRMVTAVNIIQWVSIGTAVAILSLLHLAEYVSPAIAILVGLHLLPLAEVLRSVQHYITAALLLMWAGGCLLFAPALQVSGMSALGVGVILLGSAAATLARHIGGVRHSAARSLQQRVEV